MLGKLMKYDLKAAFRSFAPLYLALLGMSLIIGLFGRFNAEGNSVLAFIAIVYGVTMIICWVIPIVILTLRFKKNLLEDEGYHSFSLPVSTLEHIVAKVLSALVITVVCALVVVFSFLIIGLISADFEQLRNAMQQIMSAFNQIFDANLLPQIFKAVVIMVLGSVELISQIYLALAIGHLFKDHETLAAVGAFIGINVILSLVMNAIHLPNMLESAGLYYVYSIALTAIFTSLTWLILDRNLNLS